MSIYKLVEAKNGRLMYFKDNKMVSPDKIDESIMDKLMPGMEIDDTPGDFINEISPPTIKQAPEEQPMPEKKCVFCGNYGNIPKFIHGQLVYICEYDRDTHTTGQLGARVKQLQSAQR